MITIRKFVFSPFQENTFVLFDETKECIIIDPGCYEEQERKEISSFIASKDLTPVRLLNTHCHLDHVFGNKYISETYNLLPEIHREDLQILEMFERTAEMYGISNTQVSPTPEKFFDENDTIEFGNSKLTIRFTPGHAPGHVVFINEEQKFVINGDVLFQGSIGRTDLPMGDMDTLITSIKTQLFTLPEDFTVYCGHGPETTIGFEKENNPFVR